MTYVRIQHGNSLILVLPPPLHRLYEPICVLVFFLLIKKKKRERKINYLQKQNTQLPLGARLQQK